MGFLFNKKRSITDDVSVGRAGDRLTSNNIRFLEELGLVLTEYGYTGYTSGSHFRRDHMGKGTAHPQPLRLTKINNNDEIRIPIQHQDAYTLPAESELYIEGRVLKKDGSAGTTVPFINNPMAYLFEEIRYEIAGITVDSTKKLGNSSTMKGLVSISPVEVNALKTSGWVQPDNTTFTPDTNGYFDFSVPLRMLLGFAEDYDRIIMNVKQELVLLRSSTDTDLIVAPPTTTNDKLEWKLDLTKICWRVPHVRLADEYRIKFLKQLDSDKEIKLWFRNWEMHEYPNLPQTNRHS